MPLIVIVGKVAVESFIVAIGVSVDTAQLGESKGEQGKNGGKKKGGTYDVFHDVTLALCGAVLFASSVAPTMEIQKLAVSSGKFQILLMIFASLALSTVILFFSNFKGTSKERPPASKIVYDLVVSYSVALVASFGMPSYFRAKVS